MRNGMGLALLLAVAALTGGCGRSEDQAQTTAPARPPTAEDAARAAQNRQMAEQIGRASAEHATKWKEMQPAGGKP